MKWLRNEKRQMLLRMNYKKAIAYENKVKPYLDEIRHHIDKLELIVDNEIWPLAKIQGIAFHKITDS